MNLSGLLEGELLGKGKKRKVLGGGEIRCNGERRKGRKESAGGGEMEEGNRND